MNKTLNLKFQIFLHIIKIPKINALCINFYYEITSSGESLLFTHRLGSSTYDWE